MVRLGPPATNRPVLLIIPEEFNPGQGPGCGVGDGSGAGPTLPFPKGQDQTPAWSPSEHSQGAGQLGTPRPGSRISPPSAPAVALLRAVWRVGGRAPHRKGCGQPSLPAASCCPDLHRLRGKGDRPSVCLWAPPA